MSKPELPSRDAGGTSLGRRYECGGLGSFISAGGNCDHILRTAVDGKLRIAWSAPILAEYRQVLLRPKFGFSPQLISSLLAIFGPGDQVSPGSCPSLPDPDDEVFLAAALATSDHVLITGNTAHFPTPKIPSCSKS